ncbi:TetR/AcrR family transcriptional regulator [soil metagenome]
MLIQSATDLFYQHGFRAISVDDIVAHGGTTKTTLYRHFVSKDALAAVCLERLADRDLAELDAIVERHSSSPLEQVRAVVTSAAARMSRPDYRGWAHSNAEVEISDRTHPARRICDLYKSRLRARLELIVRQAGYAAPASLADGLLLLIEGASASWHGLGPDGPAASLAYNCDRLMRGYDPVPPSSEEESQA